MKDTTYITALVLLQSFESSWNYYFLSDGELHTKECKEVTKELLTILKSISKKDTEIFNSTELKLDSDNNTDFIDEIVLRLTEWANSSDVLPYEFRYDNWRISWFIMGLKLYLLKINNIKANIPICWSSAEYLYSKSKLRWGPHLPHHMLNTIPKNLESELSNTKTIAVVGDIRKSQDLMTYAPSPEYFSKMMLNFMKTSRQLIKDNFGIFDKFTGDGFLAYFNQLVCERVNKDYLECFVNFVDQQIDYSHKHFKKWTSSLRKKPHGSCGLTIGADIGNIDFRVMDGHLFAIGDTIVWANRVCSAGKVNDILVNNILFNNLREKMSISLNSINSVTKAGEPFTAYIFEK